MIKYVLDTLVVLFLTFDFNQLKINLIIVLFLPLIPVVPYRLWLSAFHHQLLRIP